jgi:centromere/kinetochore protein ZW10
VLHIRKVAALWEPILQYSAWVSSIGSLANSVCSKIISDVFDLESVGSDHSERISSLIDKVMGLDDLFIRKADSNTQNHGNNGDDVQQVASAVDQFADRWMALKSLKLVLESNLEDIKFFWFEGALSDHLTAEEVVDLIGLSFENNAGVRYLKREISNNPSPRGQL